MKRIIQLLATITLASAMAHPRVDCVEANVEPSTDFNRLIDDEFLLLEENETYLLIGSSIKSLFRQKRELAMDVDKLTTYSPLQGAICGRNDEQSRMIHCALCSDFHEISVEDSQLGGVGIVIREVNPSPWKKLDFMPNENISASSSHLIECIPTTITVSSVHPTA